MDTHGSDCGVAAWRVLRGRSAAGWRCAEFIAPLPLLAVVLMVVNDHVLKGTFHNALTGKISDFAGCFFLPLYVSALLGLLLPLSVTTRLRVGAVVTCAIFVPVSVSREAADLVLACLAPLGALVGKVAFRIAVDPTDLLALPMVPAAVAYGNARHAGRDA